MRLMTMTLGALAIVGCVDVEIALNDDASGTFRLRPNVPNVRLHVTDLLSPHVHVRWFGETRGVVSIEGTFDDVTNLSTARLFRQFSVRQDRTAGAARLRVVYRNPKPGVLSQKREADLKRIPVNVTVSFPGPVRFANRGAELDGTRAVWRIPLWTLMRDRWVKLSARYAIEAAGTAESEALRARPST